MKQLLKPSLLALLFVAAVAAAPATAQAQSQSAVAPSGPGVQQPGVPQPGVLPIEIVRAHFDYTINADGSYETRTETLIKVLSPQGIELMHRTAVSFDQPFQDADIVEAYTIKPDGRRIDVPRNKMMEGYGATSAPGFSAMKERMAFFENVEVGDEVGSVIRFRQITPWYRGQVELARVQTLAIAQHDVEVTVTAPRSLALKTDVVGFDGGQDSHGAKGDTVRWRWTFHNDRAQPFEADEVGNLDRTPHILMTTFADYGGVAAEYRSFSAGKSEPDASIRALAEQVTQGATDRREIAHRLYDWVSRNIKYVAIVLGNGGLVPHAATEVLANRYGDCKDHVVLLEALLAAKGIQSTAVLIGLGGTYRLPKVAMPTAFDHVITYIPELSLYLDSTAKFAPFGVLPIADADKPVVVVSTGAVDHTPITTPANATYAETTTVRIGDDGNATGDTRVVTTGAAATEFRAAMNGVIAGQEQAYLRQNVPLLATGTLSKDDPLSLNDPYSVSAHFTLNQVAIFPGPRAAGFVFGYHPIYVTGIVAPGWASRASDYLCLSLGIDEDTTVEFPDKANIIALPTTGEASVEDITVTAKYERVGPHTVREILHANVAHPHAVCTADYYNRVHAGLMKLQALLAAQIIYQ